MTDETPEAPLMGVLRVLIAGTVLLAFLGLVGYSFWPELAVSLFGAVQSMRGIGAEEFESQYFEVRNNSDASDAQVRGVVATLENDYQAIAEYLGRSPSDPIPVLITNGQGMALIDGDRLNVFYDQGVLDLNSAPFFLVFLMEDRRLEADTNIFLEAGFAIYVTEEIGRSENFTGQPADAWVTLLQQRNALLPLSEAWAVRIPESDDDEAVYSFLRSLVMSGSFARWLIETYGQETFDELREGASLEYAIGLSLDDAEAAWLASVAAHGVASRPCRLASPPGSFLQYLCELLNETNP